MSGKSTYLRTIGANAVLAMAGAPVCARSCGCRRLALGASLRVSDSLQAGRVALLRRDHERLRADRRLWLTARPLTLFLLDEILHGTNSQDRLTGAAAIVRALVQRGAIGLVTTHDLALARLADEMGPRGDERALPGRHRRRPDDASTTSFTRAWCTRSNAMALMRLVGLPV